MLANVRALESCPFNRARISRTRTRTRTRTATRTIFGSSHLQQHPRWLFNCLLYPLQESHGLAAIHDAMIVSQCYIHHGPDDYVSLAGHWPLLDGVQAQDAALGRIYNRC